MSQRIKTGKGGKKEGSDRLVYFRADFSSLDEVRRLAEETIPLMELCGKFEF